MKQLPQLADLDTSAKQPFHVDFSDWKFFCPYEIIGHMFRVRLGRSTIVSLLFDSTHYDSL